MSLVLGAAPLAYADGALAPRLPADPGQRTAPSATTRYLRSTLHVSNDVALCVASLDATIRHSRRFDRLVTLDRYVLNASVRRGRVRMGSDNAPPMDAVVTIKGTARVRGHWQWRPVLGHCGVRRGKVVTTSIEPRTRVARPGFDEKRQPGADYVDAWPAVQASAANIAGPDSPDGA